MDFKCATCQDFRWLIEGEKTPFRADDSDTGPGEPCPDCNPCDRDHPPAPLPGSKLLFDRDGFVN